MTGVAYGYEGETSYLSFSKFTYWLSVLYTRFAPKFMKLNVYVFAQKNK